MNLDQNLGAKAIPRRQTLTPGEVKALQENFRTTIRAAYQTALIAGARPSELLRVLRAESAEGALDAVLATMIRAADADRDAGRRITIRGPEDAQALMDELRAESAARRSTP